MKTIFSILLILLSTNVCKSQEFELYHLSDSAICSLIEFGQEELEYKIYYKYDEKSRRVIDSFVFYDSRLRPVSTEVVSRNYNDFGKYSVIYQENKSMDNSVKYGFIDSFFYVNEELIISKNYEFQPPLFEIKPTEIAEYQYNQLGKVESILYSGVQSTYFSRIYYYYNSNDLLGETVQYNLDNPSDSIGTLFESTKYIYNINNEVDSFYSTYYNDNDLEEYLFIFERNHKNELIKICQFYLIDGIWRKVYECIFYPKTSVSLIDLQSSSGKLSFKNQQFYINNMDDDYSSSYSWKAFDLNGKSLFENTSTVPYISIGEFNLQNSPFILEVFSKNKRIASGKFGIINK